MTELKPKRNRNYHHKGNSKHGLYPDNAACSLDCLYDKRQPVDLDELQQERDGRP